MFRRKFTAIFASAAFGLMLGIATALAAPNKPAKTPAAAAPDRADKGERAVVFDDRYRPPAKDLLLNPGNERLAQAFAFFMQGSMAEEAYEPDRALTFYLKSLAADPSNVALGLKVSSEHVRRGDTNEAVDLLKSVIKAAPQEAQPMLALSYIYLKSLRKPDLAQKFAAQALELDTGNFLAYAYLIDALQQLNQPCHKANAVLERALKSNSRDAKFWLRLGETYYQTFVQGDGKKISPEGIKKVNLIFRQGGRFVRRRRRDLEPGCKLLRALRSDPRGDTALSQGPGGQPEPKLGARETRLQLPAK